MTAAVPVLSHPHCDGKDVITEACDDQPVGRFRWITRAGAPTTVRDLCQPCLDVLERLGFPIRRDESWAGRAVARELPAAAPVVAPVYDAGVSEAEARAMWGDR